MKSVIILRICPTMAKKIFVKYFVFSGDKKSWCIWREVRESVYIASIITFK